MFSETVCVGSHVLFSFALFNDDMYVGEDMVSNNVEFVASLGLFTVLAVDLLCSDSDVDFQVNCREGEFNS